MLIKVILVLVSLILTFIEIITAIALSKDCKYLASGSLDGSVKIFETEAGAMFHEFKHADLCTILVIFLLS